MDKETLSNYGWIVICVLVLAVMIALATPFGTYVKNGVESTTQGLFEMENKALDIITKKSVNNLYSPDYVIDGYWIHTGGVGKIFEETTCSYASVPVESGREIYLSSAILDLAVPQGIVRFTDGENQISYIRNNLSDYVINGEYERSPVIKLTVPDGATRVEFNIRASNFDARETMVVSYNDLRECWTPEKWYGKKWVVIGDSLSDPTTEYTTKQYYDYISNDTDIEIVNIAKRGTGYAKGNTPGEGIHVSFYEMAANVPTNADVITIMGSVNDMAAGIPIGEATDTELITVAGYINATFDRIFEKNPNANLGVIIPLPCADHDPINGTAPMNTYVNVLIEICENRGIPYLDLFRNSGLKPWDADFRSEYYSKDADSTGGVHPNEEGHALIAPKISDFLEKLLNG